LANAVVKTYLLATLFFLGCTLSGCQKTAPSPQDVNVLLNPLTAQEAEAIKANLDRLKLGMGEDECYKALGLDMTRQYPASGDGNGKQAWVTLTLRSGYTLHLFWDTSSGTARLVRAQVNEKKWPTQN
jgi:hypothetical protein